MGAVQIGASSPLSADATVGGAIGGALVMSGRGLRACDGDCLPVAVAASTPKDHVHGAKLAIRRWRKYARRPMKGLTAGGHRGAAWASAYHLFPGDLGYIYCGVCC